MRIVLMGETAFGQRALQALIDEGEHIVGVYTSPDVRDRPNSVKELALSLNIATFSLPSLRSAEVTAEYARLEPDLNVMAFVTTILPYSVLRYPKWGSIQWHPSLLPRHRGGNAISWAIICGDSKTGVTIFWPDAGIDTGPILLQREVEISSEDTAGSLYFNKLLPAGIQAIVESVQLVKAGKAPRIPQDESQATYEGLITKADATIDWSRRGYDIYNLIRGTNPRPGATTSFGATQFRVFDSELLNDVLGHAPGEVLSIGEQGIAVAARDAAILIEIVQVPGSPKAEAAQVAHELGLKQGSKLGSSDSTYY
jgi:methionyl-tRNA formyltransferase